MTTINGDNVTVPGNLTAGVAQIAQLLLPFLATAVSYLATATDEFIDVTATGQTVTLPDAVGLVGKSFLIKLTAAGTATIATTSAQTIDGSASYTLSAQWKYVRLMSDNANWLIVGAN